MAMWRLWAKKLINTILLNLASFLLKTMIPLFLCNSASNFQRKSQKIENNNQIFYFIFFLHFSQKTVGLSLIYSAEMNSACQNTPITAFSWDLEKKSCFPPSFCPYYSMAIWRLWEKKLINTILVEFDFFPSKNHNPIVLCNSASNFQRKSQNIKNNGNQIFYFIFCIFLKNRMVELSFQRRNEFCMPKYPNNCIFMGFGEKSCFSPNFCPYYSMMIWRLWAKKLIDTILAEFDLFPSKNMFPLFLCNSASNFQIKSQKIKNNNIQVFYFIFCIFLKNSRVELNFQCRNEFCMPKYPNNRIFMGFGEKRVFSLNYGDLEAMDQKIDQYHFGRI